MRIINFITLLAIVFLLIPVAFNKVDFGLVSTFLGINFINRAFMSKEEHSKRDFLIYLYSGIIIIIISIVGFFF